MAGGGSAGFTVVCARSQQEILICENQTNLQVLSEYGMRQNSSCEQGICGACETKVLSGELDHHDFVLSSEERERGDVMMICCSRAKGDQLVLDL
jgi:ferredoxin